MRTTLILISMVTFFCYPLLIFGQYKNEQEAAFQVVKKLFVAMETSDSTLAASLFTADAKLFTVYQDADNRTQLRSNPASLLTSAFAQPKTPIWHEPIWNEKIEIKDNLASIWVDYAFYLGDQLSHCGVDAFHLVKLNDQWKIFHLADTRRKTDCDIPTDVSSKYEK